MQFKEGDEVLVKATFVRLTPGYGYLVRFSNQKYIHVASPDVLPASARIGEPIRFGSDADLIDELVQEVKRVQNLFDVERLDNIKVRDLLAKANKEIKRLQNLFDVERSDNVKVRGLLAKAYEDMDQFRIDAYRMASLAIDLAIDNAEDGEKV